MTEQFPPGTRAYIIIKLPTGEVGRFWVSNIDRMEFRIQAPLDFGRDPQLEEAFTLLERKEVEDENAQA